MTTAPNSPATAALPAWDLVDLYPGRDSPALLADLAAAETEAVAFRDRLQGHLSALAGAEFGRAIAH